MFTYEFPRDFSITLDVQTPDKNGVPGHLEKHVYTIDEHRAALFRLTDAKAIALHLPDDAATKKLLDSNDLALRQFRQENTLPLLEDTEESLAWLPLESTIALRLYTSLYVGDAKRRSDSAPACTHFIELAHYGYNCCGLSPRIPRDVAAFIFQAHDLVEDFGKEDHFDQNGNKLPPVTPENIVKYAWRGDPAWAPFIVRMVHKFTDPPELAGQARMDLQIDLANNDKTGLLRRGRFGDKILTRLHDIWALKNGYVPEKGFEEFIRKLRMKSKTVHQLRGLPCLYKKMMDDVVNEITDIVEERWFFSGPQKPMPPEPPAKDRLASLRAA